jgi:NAD+ kinase
MSSDIQQVAILGRHEDPHVADLKNLLVRHLTKAGINILAADEKSPDLIIAIGGDGTMLYAGKFARESGVPLLGVNRGRLGFLADVSPDEMLTSVDHILKGNYTCESRSLLAATLSRADDDSVTATAFNDVVLQRRATGRMIDVVASIDGEYVNTHSGDGLIVATPTGSTAYALSCGGPIIEPSLDAMVVVPVCSHTLTDRPIVIPANKTIEIRVLDRADTHAEVTVDGHAIGDISPDDVLTVTQSTQCIQLIHPPGYNFFSILRSKLYWGRDSRNHEDGTS